MKKVVLLSILCALTLNNILGQEFYNLRVVGEALCQGKRIKKGKVEFYDSNNFDAKMICKSEKIKNGEFDQRLKLRKGNPLVVKIIYDKQKETVIKTIKDDKTTIVISPVEFCLTPKVAEIKTKTLNIRTYTTNYANVRSEPNLDSKVLFTARSGDTYEVIDTSLNKQELRWIKEPNKLRIVNDFWYEIKGLNSDKAGWIYGGLTTNGNSIHETNLKIDLIDTTEVFSAPSNNSPSNTFLSPIENIIVLETTIVEGNRWFKIEVDDNSYKITGWVKNNIKY